MTETTKNYPSKFEMFFYNKVAHWLPQTLIINLFLGIGYGTAASFMIVLAAIHIAIPYQQILIAIAAIFGFSGFMLVGATDIIERYECKNNIPAQYEHSNPFARASLMMIGFASGFAMQLAYPYILAQLL